MKVGIVGIGGLGHLGLQYANKMGCEVSAISTSPNKEEEAKGLSALADRDSAQQTTDFHSQKSKILALNFFIKTIKKIPNLGEKKIEEYLNFSIHLCSFNEELSIKGLKLAKTIFKVTFI